MKICKYDNGAVLLYEQNFGSQSTMATLGFKCGSHLDGDKAGLSHFLEHMLVSDTDKLTRNEVERQNDQLDNIQNAFTTKDCIALNFNCPSVNFVETLKLNGDFIFRTHFDEKLMKDEIRPIVEEMNVSKDENNLGNMIDKLTGATSNGYIIGTKESITSEYILGTEQSLKSITTQDFFDYMNKWFVAENFVIAISSSLSFDEVKKAVDENIIKKLVSKPENKVVIKPTEYVYIDEDTLVVADRKGKNAQNSFDVNLFFKNEVGDDFDNRKFAFFENWLFNGDTGRLNKLFREQEGLTYTSYFESINLNGLNLRSFEIVTSPKKVHTSINTIMNMLDDLITNGVSDKDMDRFYKHTISRRSRKIRSSHSDSHMFFDYIMNENKEKVDRKFYSELLSLTKKQVNDYLKTTYGMSKVGIVYNGNINLATCSQTTRQINKEIDYLNHLPYTVPDEVYYQLLADKVDELDKSTNPLPSLTDILSGFKISDKSIANMPKATFLQQKPLVFENKVFEQVATKDSYMSKQVKKQFADQAKLEQKKKQLEQQIAKLTNKLEKLKEQTKTEQEKDESEANAM